MNDQRELLALKATMTAMAFVLKCTWVALLANEPPERAQEALDGLLETMRENMPVKPAAFGSADHHAQLHAEMARIEIEAFALQVREALLLRAAMAARPRPS